MDKEIGASEGVIAIPTKGLEVKAEHKAEWVRRFKESKLSYTQFSLQQGIRRASLCKWVNQQSEAEPVGWVGFRELEISEPVPERVNWSAELRLANGNVLRLSGDVPAQTLEALLRVC